MYNQYVTSPCGDWQITADALGITSVRFCPERQLPADPSALTDLACQQLKEYFARQRQHFDIPLAPQGTPFQRLVWNQLNTVGYGRTASYRDIAQRMGRPTAMRAVGMANSKNPVAIVVPCHRIIGSNGTLTGYAGGLERKQFLLSLEGAF